MPAKFACISVARPAKRCIAPRKTGSRALSAASLANCARKPCIGGGAPNTVSKIGVARLQMAGHCTLKLPAGCVACGRRGVERSSPRGHSWFKKLTADRQSWDQQRFLAVTSNRRRETYRSKPSWIPKRNFRRVWDTWRRPANGGSLPERCTTATPLRNQGTAWRDC
jgi:hypothetical protein